MKNKPFKELQDKSTDIFWISLSGSIVLHLIILYFFLFGMPSLFEKLPEEQIITFEMLPVSDKSNIITQTKQKEKEIENEDAKKSEQSKPKELEQQDVTDKKKPLQETPAPQKSKTQEETPKQEEKKPIEEKKPEEVREASPEKKEAVKEEKPKEEEKKPEEKKEKVLRKADEKTKEIKKKLPETDELDSLLKNLEQSSEGNNLKSNKHKRAKKVNYAQESKGVYTEGLPLSVSETALIKRQIERRWSNIPAGARNNNKVRVIISITLDKSGNVEQVKVKEKFCSNISSSVCEALSDSAIRAVWQASPIENLDPARFNHWKEINFNFDPSKL